MSRRVRALPLACAAFFAAVAVMTPSTSHAQSRSRPVVFAPFRVGVIAPFKGTLKGYGQAVLRGIQMARTEKPELFDRFQIVLQNNDSDPAKSVRAFQKLRAKSNVQIIYLWGTASAEAVAPIAEEQKFPLLVMTNDPKPALGRKWVFRYSNDAEQYAKVLLGYLRARDAKRIGMIRTDIDYLNSTYDAIKRNLRSDETLIDLTILQPTDTDVGPAIASVNGTQLDALGIYLIPGQISQYFRQLGEKSSVPITFGTDDFNSMSEVQQAGPAILGSVFPGNAVESWFYEHYLQAYGSDQHIVIAANAYNFAVMTAGLFRDLPDKQRNPEKIRDFLRSIRPRVGALGEYGFRDSQKTGQYYDFPIGMRRVRADRTIPLPSQ